MLHRHRPPSFPPNGTPRPPPERCWHHAAKGCTIPPNSRTRREKGRGNEHLRGTHLHIQGRWPYGWLKNFTEAYPTREKYSKLYGMWHTDIGPLNQVIHIWQYDSLQQRADIRAAAAKDPSGLWPPKGADMIMSQEVDIIDPVKGFELRTGRRSGRIPTWELRVYTYAGGTTGKAAAAFGERQSKARNEIYPRSPWALHQRPGQPQPPLPALPLQELGPPRRGPQGVPREGRLAAARRSEPGIAARAPHGAGGRLAAEVAIRF